MQVDTDHVVDCKQVQTLLYNCYKGNCNASLIGELMSNRFRTSINFVIIQHERTN